MEVQALVDHYIAGITLQQPTPYWTTMPPHWANPCRHRVVLPPMVSVSHMPNPYIPQGLTERPYPTIK